MRVSREMVLLDLDIYYLRKRYNMQCDSQSTDPLKIAVSEQVAVSAHAQIEAQQDGKTFGFRQTKMPQQFSGADTNKDGTVSSRIEGRPIQGEDDTKRAGQMLAQAMSTANEQWELTDEPATGAVDCVLKDSSNPPRRREVQVVRAIADCKLYQQ